MIVRILNKENNVDKFYDCCATSIFKDTMNVNHLYLETEKQGCIEQELSLHDEIYYMNDHGDTINSDFRMCQN